MKLKILMILLGSIFLFVYCSSGLQNNSVNSNTNDSEESQSGHDVRHSDPTTNSIFYSGYDDGVCHDSTSESLQGESNEQETSCE